MQSKGIPHYEWECYKNMMYCSTPTVNAKEKTICFFNDFNLFENACQQVISKWVNSRNHHIKILKVNPISWLGQCANSYQNGIKEWETRKYWKDLDFKTQNKCNKIAKNVIQRYLLDGSTKVK